MPATSGTCKYLLYCKSALKKVIVAPFITKMKRLKSHMGITIFPPNVVPKILVKVFQRCDSVLTLLSPCGCENN